MLVAGSVAIAWNLARENAEHRRYHKEWGSLPIELPS
jgi:hypothetical protein